MNRETPVNREYKSSLFALIFSNAGDALSLYNAMNGTDYDDPDQLEFNTLEDVVYMGMKNDVSFLFGTNMNLYEAQSTWNPNMPLRGLFYMATLYRGFVTEQKLDIYSSTRLTLPFPRYVVFYNGTAEQPERQILRLSESFMDGRTDAPDSSAASPALECIALVININYGHNRELMEKCRKLGEYAYLVNAVRRRTSKGRTMNAAVAEAIDECIAKGILADILSKNKAEVTNMILEEYDEEFHIECEKRLSREEGRMAGREEGRLAGREEGRLAAQLDMVRKMLKTGRYSPEEIAELSDLPSETIRQLITELT